MRTIAVFKCDSIEHVPEDSGRVRDGEPIGKSVAAFVAELLNTKGIPMMQPIDGELSWFLYPKVDDRDYELSIHWATSLDAGNDLWAVEVRPKPSNLAKTFR